MNNLFEVVLISNNSITQIYFTLSLFKIIKISFFPLNQFTDIWLCNLNTIFVCIGMSHTFCLNRFTWFLLMTWNYSIFHNVYIHFKEVIPILQLKQNNTITLVSFSEEWKPTEQNVTVAWLIKGQSYVVLLPLPVGQTSLPIKMEGWLAAQAYYSNLTYN